MRRRPSPARTVLTGLILSAVPLLSLAAQGRGHEPREFSVAGVLRQSPAGQTQTQLTIETDLHRLDLGQLAGGDDFQIGDVVYVHIQAHKQQTSYPFAISQNRPKLADNSTLMLRGVVERREGDVLSLRYLFENLPRNAALSKAVSGVKAAEVTLAVNGRAVGHIKSITIEGQTYTP